MAFKMSIRIDVRCPQHRRANGSPEDTRASCNPCLALRRIRIAILTLQDHLREGEEYGLESGKQRVRYVPS